MMSSVEWDKYGTESGNPKCANCMVHSGYEATAVDFTFGSLRGLWESGRSMFFDRHPDPEALEILKEPARPLFLPDQLVQLEAKKSEVKQ